MKTYLNARNYLEQIKQYYQHCNAIDVVINSMRADESPEHKNELNKNKKEKLTEINKRKNFIMNLKVKGSVKNALILKYVCFKTHKEIARELHYSIGYVSQILKNGLSVAETAIMQENIEQVRLCA